MVVSATGMDSGCDGLKKKSSSFVLIADVFIVAAKLILFRVHFELQHDPAPKTRSLCPAKPDVCNSMHALYELHQLPSAFDKYCL